MTGSKDAMSDINSKLKVLGRGKVVISNDLSVENVLLVESLVYNLMFVLQLARSGFASYFDEENVTVTWKKSLKVAFVGFVENGMYVVDLSKRARVPRRA